jgi:hypothetical protein
MGVSIGFWTPSAEIGDVTTIAARMREIAGPSSLAFPLAVAPVRDESNMTVASYAVVRGHVPIHVDRRSANERTSKLFMFVLEVENRPVLLATPANAATAKVIFLPDEVQQPRATFGAVELTAGMALHFDIQEQFHGITGYPTGDVVADLPEAVIVQVPWERADDIGGAIQAMKRAIRRDDRFKDLINAPLET